MLAGGFFISIIRAMKANTHETKEQTLLLGDAMVQLMSLLSFKFLTGAAVQHVDRQIAVLTEALNIFKVKLDFDCLTDADGDGIPDAIKTAQTALEVISCDAKTGCCRITDMSLDTPTAKITTVTPLVVTPTIEKKTSSRG